MSDSDRQKSGSTLDDFLKEEGIYEAAKTEAVTRVISWQIAEETRKKGITKAQMAELMNTSRAQVDRALKAKGNVTIETLQRAAVACHRNYLYISGRVHCVKIVK